MTITLDTLLTAEFEDSLGFVLPPAAFRLVLHRSQVVRQLSKSIRRREITAKSIRRFVSEQVNQLKKGEWLKGDVALAAVAVALETIKDPVADEYLTTLGNLRVPEMPTSTRVARECLKRRAMLPRNQVHVAAYKGTVIVKDVSMRRHSLRAISEAVQSSGARKAQRLLNALTTRWQPSPASSGFYGFAVKGKAPFEAERSVQEQLASRRRPRITYPRRKIFGPV